MQVRLDLAHRLRHSPRVGDVRLHPLFDGSVFTFHVNVWIEIVESRIFEGPFGGCRPEELSVNDGSYVVALKLASFIERLGVEGLCLGACGAQARDLFLDTGLAPIRQFAVEFVAADVDREAGIRGEMGGQKIFIERVPFL